MIKNNAQRPGAGAEIAQDLRDAAQRTIELVYFAHIDQADWADHVLATYGIGRPHHRVLYFANKFPGISVRELMAILRITNQALARTTSQLVTLGFLEQRYSQSDRRVRQHFLSRKGEALLLKLTRHQVEQVAKSLASLGPEEIDGLWFGLEAIIRPEDRRWLLPRPLGIPSANGANDESAGANVTAGGAVGLTGSGGGRPDRGFAPAIQKAGTTRRLK
jgi:DNA-binding MarR family transcriptional regulator